jgi:hypothetical protein
MFNVKTICAGLAALALSAAISAPASAETFAGTYGVNLNGTDPGLVLNWSSIASGLTFNLPTVGSSTSFDLFSLWTNETTVNADDLAPKPIQVNFNFTLPTGFGGSINGETIGESVFFGIFQDGHVNWNNGGDQLLNFGNGGQLLAHLDNATFNSGVFGLDEGQRSGAAINATFSLMHGSVPEPATWAMMILGFGMVGAGLRMRRLATA